MVDLTDLVRQASRAHDKSEDAAVWMIERSKPAQRVAMQYAGALSLINDYRHAVRNRPSSTAPTTTTLPSVSVKTAQLAGELLHAEILDWYMIGNKRAGDCDYEHLDACGARYIAQGQGLVRTGKFVHRLRDKLKRHKGKVLREVIDADQFEEIRAA